MVRNCRELHESIASQYTQASSNSLLEALGWMNRPERTMDGVGAGAAEEALRVASRYACLVDPHLLNEIIVLQKVQSTLFAFDTPSNAIGK